MNCAGDTLVSTSVKVVPGLLSAWQEKDVTDKFFKILPDMGEVSPHTMTPALSYISAALFILMLANIVLEKLTN